MQNMNINNNMSHKDEDELYARILSGLKVVDNSINDNPDGSATMLVDLTDDAASAWEELYGIPISVGFNAWFNDVLSRALDLKEQKRLAEIAGISASP